MNPNTPWHADHSLSITDAASIISQQFPQLSPLDIQLLGEGWDNTTWRVNQQWVFRFPKNKHAATLIKNEICLLPALQNLPLQIPRPILIGQAADNFPYPFYGHVFLKGETADRCHLNHQDRMQLAEPLGFFLKTLHAFPISQALSLGVERGHARMQSALEAAKIQERLTYLFEQGIIQSVHPWLDFSNQYQHLEKPPFWVLAHGDFYARHLILNAQKQLTAIIDWGDAELLHPAIDLAIGYQFIPPNAQTIFWESYGEVTEYTKLLAKQRAIFSAVTMGWYGHQIQDTMLLQEGLQGLKFVAEIL